MALSFSKSNAFNKSYIHPGVMSNCGAPEEVTSSYKEDYSKCCTKWEDRGDTCKRNGRNRIDYVCDNEDNNGKWFRVTNYKYNYRKITDECFRPSCLYQAAAFIEKAPIPVQPLTEDKNVLYRALDGFGGVGLLDSNLDKTINAYGEASDYRNMQQIPGPSTWEVGAGTSALQGILWSWRMLTNEWKGVWKERSNYETDNISASKRLSLPDPDHSKYIIIVSDGKDTDGIGYKGNFTIIPDTESGPGIVLPGNSGGNVPFENCDAHVPTYSLAKDGTPADGEYTAYKKTCDAIAQDGVKIYAILYDANYTSNEALQYCATKTGGAVYPGVSPAEFEATLKQIFAKVIKDQVMLVR